MIKTCTKLTPFIPYYDEEKRDDYLFFYKQLISEINCDKISTLMNSIQHTDLENCLTLAFAKLTKKIYKTKYSRNQGSLIVFLDNTSVFINTPEKIREFKGSKGDILIISRARNNLASTTLNSKKLIIFFEQDIMPYIMSKIENRIYFMKKITSDLNKINAGKNRCLKKEVESLTLLGKGTFGTVQLREYNAQRFVSKSTQVYSNEYDRYKDEWIEVYYMVDLIKPLIVNKICPNLPLIYDYTYCKSCDLDLLGGKNKASCSIYFTEKADGTLSTFLNEKVRTFEELCNSLFQVAIGLYATHHYYQLYNRDVKLVNVLYYTTTPGGYWHYQIKNKHFYVPNLGYFFTLNDFGAAYSYAPEFSGLLSAPKFGNTMLFRCGSRIGVIDGEKIIPIGTPVAYNYDKFRKVTWLSPEGKKIYTPLYQFSGKTGRDAKIYTTTLNAPKATEEDIKMLNRYGLQGNSQTSLDFFNHPDIFPPFEFFNDIQDMIRMYVGGYRTTMPDYVHERPTKKLNERFENELDLYNTGASITNVDSHMFPMLSHFVSVEKFIDIFFKDMYSKIPENQTKIEDYIMS